MKVMSAVLVVLFLVTGVAFAEQKGKIAVATHEKSIEAPVSDKAGLAPYFLIFDEKGNLIETIDNPFKTRKFEAGHLIADFLPGKGITAIIGTDYCGEIVDVLKILHQIKKNLTLIVIEHKLSRIVNLVDRLCVMNEGSFICEGEPDRVLSDRKVRECYWGKGELTIEG